MLRIGTEKYFASLAQFEKHLPTGKDEELLILKGHLLIERLLTRFVDANVPRPERIPLDLRFAVKLAIASSLCKDASSDWLWEAIAALNRLRNELAHQLAPPKFAHLRKGFVALVERSPELPHLEPPSNILDRLHRAIFSVHEGLSYRVDL